MPRRRFDAAMPLLFAPYMRQRLFAPYIVTHYIITITPLPRSRHTASRQLRRHVTLRRRRPPWLLITYSHVVITSCHRIATPPLSKYAYHIDCHIMYTYEIRRHIKIHITH